MSASIFSEKSGQRLTRSERLNTNLHGKRSNCISITERNQEKKMIALSSSLPDVKNTAEKFNTCSFHHKIDHIQVSLLTDKPCVSIEPFFFFCFSSSKESTDIMSEKWKEVRERNWGSNPGPLVMHTSALTSRQKKALTGEKGMV